LTDYVTRIRRHGGAAEDTLCNPGDLRGSLQRSQQAIGVLNEMGQLARTRWVPLQDRYTAAALDLIDGYTAASARTDVNGHFEVGALQPGTYFVYANHVIFKNVLYWLVPVNLTNDTKMSLSNSNAKRNSILQGSDVQLRRRRSPTAR